jgi:hypothetical protein
MIEIKSRRMSNKKGTHQQLPPETFPELPPAGNVISKEMQSDDTELVSLGLDKIVIFDNIHHRSLQARTFPKHAEEVLHRLGRCYLPIVHSKSQIHPTEMCSSPNLFHHTTPYVVMRNGNFGLRVLPYNESDTINEIEGRTILNKYVLMTSDGWYG